MARTFPLLLLPLLACSSPATVDDAGNPTPPTDAGKHDADGASSVDATTRAKATTLPSPNKTRAAMRR
jgi:hypothetical protein